MRKTLKLLPPTLVLALCGIAVPAAAQTTNTVTVQTLAFNGRQAGTALAGDGAEPLGAADCAGTTESGVRLRLDGFTVPTGTTYIVDIWRGATGAACQTPSNRMATTTTEPPCRHVDGISINYAPVDIEIPASTLFGDACSGTTEQTFRFWFLLSTSEENRSDTTLPYGTIDATIDLAPPTAPTNVSTTPGDANIEVTWDIPGGSTLLRSAVVYIDPDGCPDGTPDSSLLVAGQAPPASGVQRIERTGPGVTNVQLNGASIGLDYGEYAAVGVVLVDRAHNESVLSEIVCVQRVQVRGFWDAYCSERGMDAETCAETYTCAAASPGSRGGSAAVLWMAAIAMVGATMRRARRAR